MGASQAEPLRGWPWVRGRRCPPHLPGGAAASQEVDALAPACSGAPLGGHLSHGTSGFRSVLLERLRFACPYKIGANLLSNFGVRTASPG